MICVENGSYAVSLELLKVYRRLPDPEAERHKMIRVIDESGEDYLYTKGYFVKLDLSPAARKGFKEASEKLEKAG